MQKRLKNTALVNQSYTAKILTDRCGCQIQYLKFGLAPILLIHENPVAKCAIILYKS